VRSRRSPTTPRGRLEPLGVHVTLIEPGYFRTDLLDGASLETEPTVIDDYAATSGAMRASALEYNHSQPGDPAKGAKAIVDITEAARPPLHLLLGTDSLAFAETKLHAELDELANWRELSASTNHDDVADDMADDVADDMADEAAAAR
jgi:hypothetical protein